MNEEEYIALIYRSIKGEISLDESTLLDKHTSLSEENAILRAEIEDSWLFSQDNSALLEEIDVEQDLLKVTQKIEQGNGTASDSPTRSKSKVVPITSSSSSSMTRRLAIAASFLALITAGYFYTTIEDNKATIYASNDKVLTIDLVDGSKVILNKNSQLTVSNDFSKTNRNVELIGEAFFDVEPSKTHTFEIEGGESTVAVLGTSFNVKVNDNNCVVGVTTGKVKLSDTDGQNEIILIKDEVGKHTFGDDRVTKQRESADNISYWQKKNVVFKNTSIQSILSQLALMYDVDIQLSNSNIEDCKVSVVSNEIAIDKVLTKVFLSLEAQVEQINEKTFVIKNGTCK